MPFPLKNTIKSGAPLFITTLCTLLLEISLTRIFSVVLFYHYAFLVISIALLGLAAGAIAARFIPVRLGPGKTAAINILCVPVRGIRHHSNSKIYSGYQYLSG